MTPRQELETVLDADHAEAIIQHRQAKRAKLTPYAAKLLAKQFAQTPDPNEAADEVIRRGWTGFKVEWLQPTGRNPQQRILTNLDRLELDLSDRIRNGTGSQGSLDFASIPRLSGR